MSTIRNAYAPMRRLRQVQPSDRLPVVASEDKVRPVVLVDRSQLAQGGGLLLVELVLRTLQDLLGDGRLLVGYTLSLSASHHMVYG